MIPSTILFCEKEIKVTLQYRGEIIKNEVTVYYDYGESFFTMSQCPRLDYESLKELIHDHKIYKLESENDSDNQIDNYFLNEVL